MKKLLGIIAIIFTTLTSFGQLDATVNVDGQNENIFIYLTNESTEATENPFIVSNGSELTDLFFDITLGETDSMLMKYVGGEFNDTLTVTQSGMIIVHHYYNGNMTSAFIFYIDNTASLSDANSFEQVDLNVYPSPATSNITIKFSSATSDMPVQIYSLNGQLVYQDNGSRTPGVNQVDVNVSNYTSGIYLATNGQETFKFVKL